MKRSARVSEMMGRLVRLPDLQASCVKMSMQMEKMGLIQEMTDDAFSALEDPDMEDEVEQTIDDV